MIEQPLTQVLILLAGSLLVVTLVRRMRLPAILGYLLTGMALGPYAFGLVSDSSTSQLLAELGVTFLLFTLGLEFSLPRMIAMRREVFGLGAAQVVATTVVFACIGRAVGVPWPMAIVVGGAISMSSTAIIVHQLTERAELNRTHGRLAFSMLLFQDLAFVPLLALASALTRGDTFSLSGTVLSVVAGVVAVAVVLVLGRSLLRPLFHEIARSGLRELFTLAALFVVLASAWVAHFAGLSLALGGFLSGMMLGETEYRHQIETVIRPFRDVLLGLFFITVGMLLDVRLLINEFGVVFSMLLGLVVLKAAAAALVTRGFVNSWFKSIRTGIVISIAGEFGIALLTIVLQAGELPTRIGQPLLVAIALSMMVSPFIIANNK
ncbi:MAG TPA: cation:proton antiporter, partial [Steroidobacteraceae bacterium]|nr:cation:proton antiporter [Steroidobacteraceae bacterium]